MNKSILPILLATLANLSALHAQTNQAQGDDPSASSGDPRQETAGQNSKPHPPKNPVMEALDKNHDHVLDEQEIAAAPEALKSLDKNNDGKLTQEEVRPPHPPQAGGGTPADDQQVSKSEQRRQEREMRKESRNQDQQNQPSGQSGPGAGRPGPPPPPPPGR
jgi:hypothetical protein